MQTSLCVRVEAGDRTDNFGRALRVFLSESNGAVDGQRRGGVWADVHNGLGVHGVSFGAR